MRLYVKKITKSKKGWEPSLCVRALAKQTQGPEFKPPALPKIKNKNYRS
jgi:hypothetical protein